MQKGLPATNEKALFIENDINSSHCHKDSPPKSLINRRFQRKLVIPSGLTNNLLKPSPLALLALTVAKVKNFRQWCGLIPTVLTSFLTTV